MRRGTAQSSSTYRQSCRRDTFGRIAKYRFAARSRPGRQLTDACYPDHVAYLEHLSDLQSNLFRLSQCTLSDQLDNLGKILLLLQDLLGSCSEINETGVDFLVMGVEDFEVFGVGYAILSATPDPTREGLAYFQSTDGKSDCQLSNNMGTDELTFSLSQSLG